MVKVYIAIKRRLSVGDKMAGVTGIKVFCPAFCRKRHALFCRRIDSRYRPESLGRSFRMNVGQILETHLGWAAKSIGEGLNELWEQNSNLNNIKNELKKVYSSPDFDKFVDQASAEDIRRFMGRLKKGMLVGSPVFDGCPEDQIREMLKKPICRKPVNPFFLTAEPANRSIRKSRWVLFT